MLCFRWRLWGAIGLALWVLACQPEAETPERHKLAPRSEAPHNAPVDLTQPASPATREALNVVLITMDTTRADALGSYGQPLPSSPNLDRIAAEGTQFLHCVSSGPTTLPSHSSILTGKFPFSHGARSNAGHVLSEENETLAEVLRANGYKTGAEIAAPVIGAHTQLDQGFDHYRDLEYDDIQRKTVTVMDDGVSRSVELPERDGADITRHALRFLRRHKRDKFFLWLHYFDPHQPYSPPLEVFEQAGQSAYHGEIRYIDALIHRVIQEIEALGLRDRTLVVITADHGDGLGEHDESTHSFFVYDSTIRVPLLFWGATTPRGLQVASLVRTVDITPTILDWLGLSPLQAVQGTSLRPLLVGASPDLDLIAYGESIEPYTVFGASILRYVRVGSWKYIHKVGPELFDLATDPAETRNLASEYPERLEEFRVSLSQLIAEAPASPEDSLAELDPDTAAQLEALGYIAAAPTQRLSDEPELLKLSGVDPSTLHRDIRLISEGLGLVKSQKYEESADRYRQVLVNHPNSLPTIQKLIGSLHELDADEERAEMLRRWIELQPEASDPYVKLAEISFKGGDRAHAKELLNKALEIDPCSEGARATLAHLALQKGEHSQQLRLLREGVTNCTPSDSLLNNFAYALATAPADADRDGVEALRIAKEITSSDGGDRPDFLDTLASAHAEVGDFEAAVATQRRVIALLDSRGESIEDAHEHLAQYEAGRPVREN